MKQYVIIARDGDDEDALNRRLNARPIHLEGARKLKADNHFVIGGAMLNDAGHMKGSVMIVQFKTEEEFQKWYDNEPYMVSGVWKTIEIQTFKVADV